MGEGWTRLFTSLLPLSIVITSLSIIVTIHRPRTTTISSPSLIHFSILKFQRVHMNREDRASGFSGASFLPGQYVRASKLRKARNRLFVNQLNELIRDHDHRHSYHQIKIIIPLDFAVSFNSFNIRKTLSFLHLCLLLSPSPLTRLYDSISDFRVNLSIQL